MSKSLVHILDSQTGKLIAQTDTQVGEENHSTNTWRKKDLVFDRVELAVIATDSSRHYQIELGLYDLVSGARSSIYNEIHIVIGDHIIIDYPINP